MIIRPTLKRTDDVLLPFPGRKDNHRGFDVTMELVQDRKRIILHIIDVKDDEVRSVQPASSNAFVAGDRQEHVESAILQCNPEKSPVLLVSFNDKDRRDTRFPTHKSRPDAHPPGCSPPDINGHARGAPGGQTRE